MKMCIDFYEASKTDTTNLKPELTTATMQVQEQTDRYPLPLFFKEWGILMTQQESIQSQTVPCFCS